ncbi:MAG: hypothetical protein NTW86_20415, partial [Candidatus Sumerlaeota bacterium]|nr:hypothetical protein [Candidatus Sumerlaeota bacterium]
MSRIRIRGESWLAIAILLAASAATGSRAAAYTLGGIIYGDANPLAGATVTLIDSGSGATLDARTTGPTGAYAFTVANGLYNLTIDPPASSGYFGSEVKGIAVNGADVTQDVILLQQNNTVNGRVLIVDPDTSETRPLPYAHVYVGHVPWSFLLDVGTDDNGYFEAALTAGTYEFRVYNEYYPGQDPTLPMPALFCVTAATLDVGGSMTQDLRLRFSKVFGKTRGGGSPVADVQLKLDNYDSTYEQWHGVTDTAQSDASGDYTFYAWPGSYQLTALPPVGCGYGLTRVDGLSVTGDMAYDIALAAVAPYRGTIGALDHATSATAPVGNIWAIITTDADPPVELAKTLTDAAGAFEFALSAGTYRVEAHADFFEPPTNPSVPWRFWLPMKTLSLAGDTTEDLVLPIIRVHGRTMGDGVPVGGVALEALYWKNYRDTVDERTTSNGAGEFTLWLTPTNPGELDMTITPPESSDYLEERTTGYSFATHTERDILLTRGAIVHGRLTYDFTDPSESFPVPDGSVKLTVEPPSPGPFYPFFADTDASGNYRKALKPGYYRVGMIASVNDVIPGPDGLGLSDLGHLQLVDDLSYDVHVPVCRLDVRTVDRNGVPVSGIRIDLDSPGGNDWQMEINKQTDGQGTARLYASPAAPVRETITPPAASGFVQTVLEHLPISTNVRQNITMDLRDVAPPKILCGPYVNAITDASALVEWRTDEWSTSVVEYGVTTGLGQSASAPDLSVGHAVRLTGLAPDTRYYWRVLSDDAAHNGPTASDIRQFYTEPLPDTAPPAFTDWPIVHSITDCAATVEWATDEPACGCVDYGVAETLGLTVDVP